MTERDTTFTPTLALAYMLLGFALAVIAIMALDFHSADVACRRAWYSHAYGGVLGGDALRCVESFTARIDQAPDLQPFPESE
jgi:hypothetical protein